MNQFVLKWFRLSIVVALSIAVSACSHIPTDSSTVVPIESDTSDVSVSERFIEKELIESGIPGLSASIVKNGKAVWTKGFGFADRENKIPFTQNTIMNVASTSKTVIGCSVMIAKEQGLIDLDQDVNTYLRAFNVTNPYQDNFSITLRKLATHTSGIIDRSEAYSTSYHTGGDSPESLTKFLKEYLTLGGDLYEKTNFEDVSRGITFHYSNIGAAFAAYILECVTGQDYKRFTEENIFKKLGMEHTSWMIKETDMSKHAVLYAEDGIVEPYGLTTYPDGGLRTTACDFARFMAMVLNKGELDGKRVMNETSVNEMLRLQFDENNMPMNMPLVNEGIFWEIEPGNINAIGHNGKDPGMYSYMALLPKDEIGVFLMINSDLDDTQVNSIRLIITRLWELAYHI